MSRNRWTLKLWSAVAVIAILAGFPALMFGQGNSPQRVPMIEDWSTHHSVFSHPRAFEQATKTRTFLEWYKVQTDPRYQFAQIRRNAARMHRAGAVDLASTTGFADTLSLNSLSPNAASKSEGDWSNYLGGATNAGIGAAMFPAKYTWDANAAPDCTNDFLVVPVNQPPANQATAAGTIVIHAEPASAGTVTIGGVVYTFETTCRTTTYCATRSRTLATDATNLEGAINGSCDGSTCAANPGVKATASGSTVTLTAIASGSAGNVALATSDDAALYLNGVSQASSTLTGGADGQASIIAFNNLYYGGTVGASQIGTLTSNSADSGATVTIGTGAVAAVTPAPMTDATVTLTASAPSAEKSTLTFTAAPSNASTVTIGSTTYTFATRIRTVRSGCSIYINGTNVTNLYDAITLTGTQSATTYRCATGSTANSAVVASLTGTTKIALTAVTPGATGFTESTTGATHIAYATTAGSDGVTSGTTFAYWSGSAAVSTTQLAANIATAINDNTTLQATTGVSATSSGNMITVTARTGGTAGNNITLGGNLAGFTWGGTELGGGMDTGPCTSGPIVMWAYKASTAATAAPMLGSPILSYDGTKVAFIESATTGAILHVLRWKSGDGGTNLSASPVTPTTSTITGSDYTRCLAGTDSCMFNLTLGTHDNTNSPPFYDYASDSLWVGDNDGYLWKVTGVFNGTPALAAAPWSTGVEVDNGATLTGPLFDSSTGNVWVGDSTGRLSYVPNSTGALSATNISGLGAITDPPMLDPSTGHIYVFSGGSGASSLVTQATTSPFAQNAQVNLGTGAAGSQIHDGMFDNNYFNSPDSTGNLYVCGSTTAGPALYSIGISGGVMSSSADGGPLDLATTAAAQQCSPLTEIYNPNEGSGTDWLFVGVPADCAFGGSTTGCIISFEITGGFPAGAYATGAETGGTSGIIVDNVSTSGQTSSTYFTTLASPGTGGCTGEPSADSTTCLIKRTQAGLQ